MLLLGKKIKFKTTKDSDLHGEFKIEEMTIYINPDSTTIPETVLHEMFHAILAITGHDELLSKKQAEAMCRIVEHLTDLPGLSEVVLDFYKKKLDK